AYTAGVVLVAAGPNVEALRTYPARFKSLIGVGRGRFADPEGLRSEITADYEIVAPGEEVLAPALGGGERHWTGTSFACPHVAGPAVRPPAGAGAGAPHRGGGGGAVGGGGEGGPQCGGKRAGGVIPTPHAPPRPARARPADRAPPRGRARRRGARGDRPPFGA